MREGNDFVINKDRSSIKVLGTVGEPIKEPEWMWYYNVVGENRCPIVDTWWQTETGGILITPLPAATEIKPGSAAFPFFGVTPVILDPDGNELHGNPSEGLLAIKTPWPGQMRTVYGDHARFETTYFETYKGFYFTGDGCRRDDDGYGGDDETAEERGVDGDHPSAPRKRTMAPIADRQFPSSVSPDAWRGLKP